MGLKSVNHTSFTVAGVVAAAEWYRDMLGFEIVSDARRPRDFCEAVTGIPGAEMRIIYLKAAGYSLELIQYTGGAGVRVDTATNNSGSAHLCFNVEGLPGMYDALRRKGVRFFGAPVEIPEGPNKGGLVVYFDDLEGNTIEFIEVPEK